MEEKVLNKEVEAMWENQEEMEIGKVIQKQQRITKAPSSPWKYQFVSCNLEERFGIMVKFSSLDKMERIDEWLKENKGKPKKKNSRDPSMMSLAQTRSHGKSDLGGR